MFQLVVTVLALGLSAGTAVVGMSYLAPVQSAANARIAALDGCAGAQAVAMRALEDADPQAYVAAQTDATTLCGKLHHAN